MATAARQARRGRQRDECTGRFEAGEQVEVPAGIGGIPKSGPINKVHFADRQMVNRGGLLSTSDPRAFQIDVDPARADVSRTRAEAVPAAGTFG